jgi:hypothetical protein
VGWTLAFIKARSVFMLSMKKEYTAKCLGRNNIPSFPLAKVSAKNLVFLMLRSCTLRVEINVSYGLVRWAQAFLGERSKRTQITFLCTGPTVCFDSILLSPDCR